MHKCNQTAAKTGLLEPKANNTATGQTKHTVNREVGYARHARQARLSQLALPPTPIAAQMAQ